MNVFVFDIETVPDVEGAHRLYGLGGLDEGCITVDTVLLRQAKPVGVGNEIAQAMK